MTYNVFGGTLNPAQHNATQQRLKETPLSFAQEILCYPLSAQICKTEELRLAFSAYCTLLPTLLFMFVYYVMSLMCVCRIK